MKKAIQFLCLSLFFAAFGCSPISVKSDYDREVDFVHYQTFKWMPFPKGKRAQKTVKPNSLLDKRIRRAVESQLREKGYEMVRSGEADVLLAYHIGVKQRVDVSYVGYGYWRWPRGRVHAHRYKEGTLIVDMVDPNRKQLVWRGWAVGVVGNVEVSEEKINQSVTKILEKFPPL
ncbi:MAG: DUF4136 domain-containing protein [bacterium]